MTTDTVGGVWTYAVQLARALEPHGAEIALATAGAPLSADQWKAVAALRHVRVFESRFKLEWMQGPWEDVRAAGLWLLRIADEFRPDIVHLNDYSHGALDWAVPVLIVGHSCVLSWHRAVRGLEAGPEWDRYRQSVAAGLRAADLVVAPTQVMLDSLDSDYGPLPHRRVILNGRDIEDRRVAWAAHNKTIGAHIPHDKEPLVLTAGRVWDEGKNIAALAAAAPSVRWAVAVAGDVRHPDGGEVALEGVRQLGRLDPGAMRQWFRRAAIYAHPARYEPFGLAPLDAALEGCALVLGEIATLREIWQDAAVFVPPGDAAALADAINDLIGDDALRSRLAFRAWERAGEFAASRMAAEYAASYRELCAGARRRERVPAGGA